MTPTGMAIFVAFLAAIIAASVAMIITAFLMSSDNLEQRFIHAYWADINNNNKQNSNKIIKFPRTITLINKIDKLPTSAFVNSIYLFREDRYILQKLLEKWVRGCPSPSELKRIKSVMKSNGITDLIP